jgi:hypothetical protein
MSAPSLSRHVFKTSRLAEFSSKKELVNQTGHAVEDWPLVVLKELLDNALDSTEEAGIAPVIEISVSQDDITVADNGPSIAPETVADIIDYTARMSSQLIEFVEGKLTEHGIRKVVPAKDRLDKAFRLFARSKLVEEAVEKVIEAMPADTIAVPEDLDARVRDYLDENPKSPWEEAVARLAEAGQ